MSVGTLLVGTAFLVVLVAYVARPLRTPTEGVARERATESWIAQIRREMERRLEAGESASLDSLKDAINYCPECGRRVNVGDRFCSGCGTKLRGGEA